MEELHPALSIQAVIAYNLLKQILEDSDVFQYIGPVKEVKNPET